MKTIIYTLRVKRKNGSFRKCCHAETVQLTLVYRVFRNPRKARTKITLCWIRAKDPSNRIGFLLASKRKELTSIVQDNRLDRHKPDHAIV